MKPSPVSRDFVDRLGLQWPLVQAPMAGFQSGALAGAVAAAGALGSLPGAALAPAVLRDEVASLRERGVHALNLNFFSHVPPPPDPAREAAWRAALRPYFDEL